MDPIKEAFQRIKQDIDSLREEIRLISQGLIEVSEQINSKELPPITDRQTDKPTHNPTNNSSISPFYGLISSNKLSSTGNRGVPTDRQTNQQTDKDIIQTHLNDPISEFRRAKDVLNSLDSLKQEIRTKFKGLTPQEMTIFAQIYVLDDQKEEVSYRIIADKTGLSESSIRDYVNKLTKKGIPIDKIKQNNKKITLKIPQDLKNIATLDTIIQLRSL